MSKFRKRFRDISIKACPVHAPPIVAITNNRVLHRLKLCLVHVVWLHIDDTKDIQNHCAPSTPIFYPVAN
jgi:hypothetical protein